MVLGHETSPYLKRGRLADVIAALQIMGAGERPEREIKGWARELSYSDTQQEIEKWTSVFREHPEFFLVYHLKDDPAPKSTLRWRYTNKLYDPKTGKEFTPQEKEVLPEGQRWLLTTRPLTSESVGTLMNTAIALHSRAIEELSASRWWVPIIAACLGFGGAVLGAIVSSLWGAHR